MIQRSLDPLIQRSLDRTIVRPRDIEIVRLQYGRSGTIVARKKKPRDRLGEAVELVSEGDGLAFLDELLKPTERKTATHRWKVLYELAKSERNQDGRNNKQIADDCKVSQGFVTSTRRRLFEVDGVCLNIVNKQLDND